MSGETNLSDAVVIDSRPVVHPSALPALLTPRSVTESIALAMIWEGWNTDPDLGAGLSREDLPALVLCRGGQRFLVNVEVY